MTENVVIRCAEDPGSVTQDLLREALSMLNDLHNGYGWDELHTTLDDLVERASELGVEVDHV